MKEQSPISSELVLDEIQRAKHDLLEAEGAFEVVLRQIEALPRAQKTAISEAVSQALGRLRAAREKLDHLVAPA